MDEEREIEIDRRWQLLRTEIESRGLHLSEITNEEGRFIATVSTGFVPGGRFDKFRTFESEKEPFQVLDAVDDYVDSAAFEHDQAKARRLREMAEGG